jgi:ankyrin repeat protein
MAVLELFADRNTEEMNHAVNSNGSNVVLYAAEVGNFEAVNYLSVRGVNLNVQDRLGKTLLIKVLASEMFELAGKLTSRGADVNF